MKALMSMDYFFSYDTSEKAQTIIQIQRYLNRNYENYTGIRPCDGIYGSSTNKAIIFALQAEEKMPVGVANGNFGPSTRNCCPVVRTTTCVGRNYIGQYYDPTDIPLFAPLINMSLYLNGFGQASNALSTSLNISDLNEFQNFYSIPVVNECNLTTWMSLMVSSGNPNRNAIACDCATIITNDNISVLTDNNYQYVGRYLSGTIDGGISKALSIQELQLLFANNIRVFPIHQGAANYVGYFTTANANADATSAINHANSLNLEFGSIIYFAVDCDVMDYQVTNNIIPYFRTLYEKFMSLCGGKYRVGIYGTRNTCSRVCDAGYACSSFVSDMSTGYSGNLGFAIPENWAFDQFANTTISNNAGTKSIEIDKDGYSGKYRGISQEYSNIVNDQYNNTNTNSGSFVLINMGTSINVYESKTFANWPLPQAGSQYITTGNVIGQIHLHDMYLCFGVADPNYDNIHKVLFNDGIDVKMGYIVGKPIYPGHGYDIDNPITARWQANWNQVLDNQEAYACVRYNPNNDSYTTYQINQVSQNPIEINKPVPYFNNDGEYIGTLKKGDRIVVTQYNMTDSEIPWCYAVHKIIYRDNTEVTGNYFVSVGLEYAPSGINKAWY